MARLLRARHAQERKRNAQLLEELDRQPTGPGFTITADSVDERALRGLPAIGRGVSGEIRGSRPVRTVR
jgi:hypothetical protein